MTNERSFRYYPIVLFASVMGLAGVTISVRLAETLYEIGHLTSTLLLWFTSLLFILNGTILLYRFGRYYNDVKMDLNHPVKMNFYGTVSISLLLLSSLFNDLNSTASLIIWSAGAIVQLSLTLIILSKVIWDLSLEITQFNPTWFIPIVGNVIVPIAGIYHVSPVVNWLFFSIGIVFSIVYLTIFINRIIFHPPLPAMLTPTFFILLAPPGIGVVSYIQLTGQVDIVAYIFFGVAFYLGLLFIYQFKRFISIPFTLSWWAYLFPTAAVTNATIFMYNETGDPFFSWLIPIQLIGLGVLTIYLLWKTSKLAFSGFLITKE